MNICKCFVYVNIIQSGFSTKLANNFKKNKYKIFYFILLILTSIVFLKPQHKKYHTINIYFYFMISISHTHLYFIWCITHITHVLCIFFYLKNTRHVVIFRWLIVLFWIWCKHKTLMIFYKLLLYLYLKRTRNTKTRKVTILLHKPDDHGLCT